MSVAQALPIVVSQLVLSLCQVTFGGLFIPVFRLAERSESVVEWIREPGSEPMVGDDAFITF